MLRISDIIKNLTLILFILAITIICGRDKSIYISTGPTISLKAACNANAVYVAVGYIFVADAHENFPMFE